MPDMNDLVRAYQSAGRHEDEDGYVPLAKIKAELIRSQNLDATRRSLNKGENDGTPKK